MASGNNPGAEKKEVMVDKRYIEKLFEKHKITQEDDKEDVLKVLQEIKQEQQVEKVITSFEDAIDLAKKIIEPREIYGDPTDADDKGNIPLNQFEPVMPLHYDKAGIWWRWSSGYRKWEMIDEVDLMNFITYCSPADTINSKKRGELLQAFKQVARANAPRDAPREWLQFDKEIVDLKTGDRFEASWKYFLTNPIPHKIGVSGDTPVIDRIFAEWVGEENVLLLKEIMAYCMIRDYPIHRIFCFIGSGLNGKSKYLEFLRRFIGEDNCCSTELDTLLNSRFEVTRLHKKLVCQMGETNFNEMNKTSMLKKLSGGDLIGFEYKNKTPFEDLNYSKITISTNNLPATSDKTKGFYRRWIIIDFPNEFSEKKDILSEIPDKEYNNLANQLVGVLMDLLSKREFHNEGTIEERMKKYEDHSNPLEKFWVENVCDDSSGHIYKHEFRQKLVQWCKENRFREISDRSVSKMMKEKGVIEQKVQADWFENDKKPWIRAWIGISFK